MKDVFSLRRRFRYFQVDVAIGLFARFRSASRGRQLDYLFRRGRLIDAFLEEAFAPAGTVRARGIRLSYEQARKYPQALRWAARNDLRVIHLLRENGLKAIVSHFTAKKRGVAHATSPLERVTLRLPPREVERLLAQRHERVERYRAMLGGQRYCEVTYESFLARKEAETRRLLDFLGVERFVPLTSRLVKQNPDSLRDILENYEEIARALRGTAFEHYLTM